MRKGHGSTKVPNVKLRPAAAGSSSLKHDHSANLPDPIEPGDEGAISELKKGCKRPFAGIVVCASALADKAEVLAQAEQLGSQISTALTDRVTHLLTNGPGSAKYLFCVENNIPIMKPSWIRETYKAWLSGEDVDISDLVTKHALETFSSVRLCLTGIDLLEKRTNIHKLLTRNGGVFIKDLNADSEITHLLCGVEEGQNMSSHAWTPKMQYVQKLNKMSKTTVHIVWEEWFWDCLEYGGLLNENNYSIGNPRPKRKPLKNVAITIPSLVTVPASDCSSIPPSIPSSSLVNTTDAEELALVKRLPETTMQLWGGLLKKRGVDVQSGKIVRSPTKSQQIRDTESTFIIPSSSECLSTEPIVEESVEDGAEYLQKLSLSRFKRDKSTILATSVDEEGGQLSLASSSKRTLSFASSELTMDTRRIPASSSFMAPYADVNKTVSVKGTLFSNMRFRVLGEANSPALREAIEFRGGIVVSAVDEVSDITIVRLVSGSNIYCEEGMVPVRSKYRTECWLERCIFEERICAASEHPAFMPLKLNIPVKGVDKLVVHFSGLGESERCWSLRIARALRISVTEKFTKRTTQLICPSGQGPKFDRAQLWCIPVVTVDWLFSIARAGEIVSASDFLVISHTSVCYPQYEDKGITDITNSVDFSQGSDANVASHTQESMKMVTTSAYGTPKSCVEDPNERSSARREINVELFEYSGTASDRIGTSSTITPGRTGVNLGTTSLTLSIPSPCPKAECKGKRKIPKTNSRNTELAEWAMRIPSSKSPSPLKIPSERSTKSPTSVSGESTKALKATINSLLGKRVASEEPEGLIQVGKAGKRIRPTRSRSKQDIHLCPAPTFPVACSSLYPPALITSPRTPNGFDLDSKDGLVNESMRVTYEDPGQRDEKLKLLSLLGNDESVIADGSSNAAKKKSRSRRTSRILGL